MPAEHKKVIEAIMRCGVKGHPISSSYGHLKFPTLG
jgi:hypothetical protein